MHASGKLKQNDKKFRLKIRGEQEERKQGKGQGKYVINPPPFFFP